MKQVFSSFQSKFFAANKQSRKLKAVNLSQKVSFIGHDLFFVRIIIGHEKELTLDFFSKFVQADLEEEETQGKNKWKILFFSGRSRGMERDKDEKSCVDRLPLCLCTLWRFVTMITRMIRKAPFWKVVRSNGHCPKSFCPPIPLCQTGTLWRFITMITRMTRAMMNMMTTRAMMA